MAFAWLFRYLQFPESSAWNFIIVFCLLAAVLVCVVGCFFDGLRTIIPCAFNTRTQRRHAKMVKIRFILSGVSCLFMILHYRVHYLIPIKLVAQVKDYFWKTYTCSPENRQSSHTNWHFSSLGTAFQGNFTCSLISGRMRYAPTPIRLKSGLHWVKIQSQIDRFNHRVSSNKW